MLPTPLVITHEELDVLIEQGHLDKEHVVGPKGAKLAGIPHYFNSISYKDGNLQFYRDVRHLGITLTRDQLGYCSFKIPTNVVQYDTDKLQLPIHDTPNEINGHSELSVNGVFGSTKLFNFSGLPFEQPVVFIDIETLGVGADSVILQIGAAFGDLVTGRITSVFNTHIRSKCALNSKRRVDLGTVLWHVKERERNHTFHKQMPLSLYDTNQFYSLEQALKKLAGWLAEVSGLIHLANQKQEGVNSAPPRLLCKGPEFDLKLLEDAYNQARLDIPWNYRNVGSVRTYEHLYADLRVRGGETYKTAEREISEFLKARSLIAHDGLFDAITEFELVYEISKLLGTNNPVLE